MLATIDEAIRRRQSEALANDEQFRQWLGRGKDDANRLGGLEVAHDFL